MSIPATVRGGAPRRKIYTVHIRPRFNRERRLIRQSLGICKTLGVLAKSSRPFAVHRRRWNCLGPLVQTCKRKLWINRRSQTIRRSAKFFSPARHQPNGRELRHLRYSEFADRHLSVV